MAVQPISFIVPSRDPIAITGMACRFPGHVNSAADLWDLLVAGRDAISEVSPERWNLDAVYHPDAARPGKTYARHGGFVDDVLRFDAAFFGMSPREAGRADPQQRLLLEVAWEALEDAGLPPESLAGRSIGTFVGISSYDYGGMQVIDKRGINAYTNAGAALSIAANRLAYHLDLRGPSVAIDTACSSSLVACHLACQSIQSGESEMALLGGVNVILRPEGGIGFSKAGMLARDGRCKAFDARADGFVRAEGVAVIVLKPLSQALADSDSVYALLRGTYVNQDGRTLGIALPSEDAQERMLREAYERARVRPHSVDFVEAHGTGTPAGDPIELGALSRVLGVGRRGNDACIVGSIKSNIGHTEAASGMAGLIKTALALHHGMIPGNLHFQSPNPKIPFHKNGLRVARGLEPWPRRDGPSVAGVNSFGFGGTNAHAILESVEPVARRLRAVPAGDDANRGVELVALSARSEGALRALANKFAKHFTNAGGSPTLKEIAASAAMRRSHLAVRLSVAASDVAELVERLEAYARGESRFAMTAGRAREKASRLAWVFGGMGPQWWGMGRELLQTESVYRRTVQACSDAIGVHTGWALIDELLADESCSRMQETAVAQPAIFATQVALAALLRSWGLEPEALIGHSVGEVAAAHVGGALSLEDAACVIYHRSRLQARLAGSGRMLAVGLSPDELSQVLEAHPAAVSLAAVNSPRSVTLAGDAAALAALAAALEKRESFVRFLSVEVPYHSHLMDSLEPEIRGSLGSLAPRDSRIPLVSTVTGEPTRPGQHDADYWWRNVRQAVLFAKGIESLLLDGFGAFLELSPHPTLQTSMSECALAAGQEAIVAHTLRKQEPERTSVLGAIGKLHTGGVLIDWARMHPLPRRFCRLPTYAWQGQLHWHESDAARRDRLGEEEHPLLGRRRDTSLPTWEREIEVQQFPYLSDHRVQGAVVYPAAAFVEMSMAAASAVWGVGPTAITEMVFHRALFLAATDAVVLQTTLDPDSGSLTICSRSPDSSEWTRHVTAEVHRLATSGVAPPASAEPPRGALEVPGARVYAALGSAGLEYGPSFRGISRLWVQDSTAVGEIRSPLAGDTLGYTLHPAILDACFQTFVGTMLRPGTTDAGATFLPIRIGRIACHGPLPNAVVVRARLGQRSERRIVGKLEILDPSGAAIAVVDDFECRSLDRFDQRGSLGFYEERWHLQPLGTDRNRQRADRFLPPPSRLVAAIRNDVRDVLDRLGLQRQSEQIHPTGETLSRSYIASALVRLGWNDQPMRIASTPEIAARLGVLEVHYRYFSRLLRILADAGMLARAGEDWVVQPIEASSDTDALWKKGWNTFPGWQAESALLRRCGRHIAEVLTGDVDPLALLFPDGSTSIAEHLYQDGPTYRFYNTVIQRTVAEALRYVPKGDRLRILEIGGGTGGLTSYVLPILPRERAQYVFTDIGHSLVAEARQKFGAFPFVEYRALDIEGDLESQSVEAGWADIVLASDVIHATRDLRSSLRNVRRILAPGGHLMMIEVTRVPVWMTITFGMIKGWWAFTDFDLRPLDPCLSADRWKDLLLAEGFQDVALATDVSRSGAIPHSVVVASAPPAVGNAIESHLPITTCDQRAAADGYLVFADAGGAAEALVDRLRVAGYEAVVVRPADSPADNAFASIDMTDGHAVEQTVNAAFDRWPHIRHVVHCRTLDAGDLSDPASVRRANEVGPFSLLRLAQALGRRGDGRARLIIVTAGVHAVEEDDRTICVSQASICGMARSVGTEYPQLRTRTIDLSASRTTSDLDALARELTRFENDPGSEGGVPHEDLIALRAGSRYVPRLARVAPAELRGLSRTKPLDSSSFRVEQSLPGSIDHLSLVRMERLAPGRGEVEIAVAASALNFKDVMFALGAIPEDAIPISGHPIGLECAGRIAAVGEGVAAFRPGDLVVAAVGNSLATHVLADARFVCHAPTDWGPEELTTFPIAMLTAWYGLKTLARLAPGERVLVHAGAGGVGLAAIQVAQHLGAEVYATAGSPFKRDLLEALDVRFVMDSRSTAFAEQLLERTHGEGVDVVLNSLAGDALRKSLGVLRPYGRFVEIGVRDIYANASLGLAPFRRNLSLMSVDLSRMALERPDQVRGLLDELLPLLNSGSLRPLAHRTYPLARLQEAFRQMARGRHFGKVVVSFADRGGAAPLAAKHPVVLRDEASYMVTGGLGGVGLAFARGLVDRGARHLVLIGRSGASSDEAKQGILAMEAIGARVRVVRCDVCDRPALERVFRDISETMPPLRGIAHAAMVLEDALLSQLDEERFEKALLPKMLGGWNLDRLSEGMPLDFFVLFSSFSAVFGNPGQANYVAGNSFLDALVVDRHLRGLPALAVAWGAIVGTGYLMRAEGISEKVERIGLHGMPVAQVIGALFNLMERPQATYAAVANVDWRTLIGSVGATPARLSQLFDEAPGESASPDAESLIAAVQSASPEVARVLMIDRLRDRLGKVLGMSPSDVDVDLPCMQLGIDSLMALELKTGIQNDTGIDVPTVKFLEGLTARGLGDYLIERMVERRGRTWGTSGNGPLAPEEANAVLANLDQLSAEDVDRHLERLIGTQHAPMSAD